MKNSDSRTRMAEEQETETETGKETEGSMSSMTPWEQHSGVISIPRFDYNAPSSLLHHSHSGFLITCTIKREKSATKEAMSILEKYVGSFNAASSDRNVASKRRKIYTQKIDGNCVNGAERKSATNDSEDAGKLSEDTSLSPVKAYTNIEGGLVLSLVKLTRSGLLLFTFPRDGSPDTVDIVSDIIHSLESGSLRPPLWCHRIFPIQATSILNEKEVCRVVSRLVLQFVNDKGNKLARPMKFAVGYNRRGIEETEMKISKNSTGDSSVSALLDRNKCFSVVAAAVKDIVSDSVVDLKNPEVSVLVELLPLSGVQNGSLVVAISVLPQNLVSTKPRLCIKALLSDSRTNTGRS